MEITKEKKPKRIYTNVSIDSPFRSRDSSSAESLKNDLTQKFESKNGQSRKIYCVSQIPYRERWQCGGHPWFKDLGFGLCEQVMAEIKRSVFGKWKPSSNITVREFYKTHTTFPKGTSASKIISPYKPSEFEYQRG